MPFAISIKSTGATASPLRELWAQFEKLEPAPSMAALNYPPHLTLAVYDAIAEYALRDALRVLARSHPPLQLRFRKLASFDRPQLVFYAAPNRTERLLQMHALLHGLIDPALCRDHYRTPNWVPHCTLATQVTEINRPVAKALAERAFNPFDVEFDTIDCVEFYPVRVIEEYRLTSPS